MISFFKVLFYKLYNPDVEISVISWANQECIPDLNSGRWVICGKKNYYNYFKSGTFFYTSSLYDHSKYPYDNCIVGYIKCRDLEIPFRKECGVGILKSVLLGQFLIR